jgi:ferredoxin--NADP+ reductase
VIYGVGARADRPLDVAGEHLRGVIGSPEIVGWYNGHTDVAADSVDLATDRVVVIGNGNVALDIARMLLSDPSSLAQTDIADHALDALRDSAVREVVLVGRRGPGAAAFTRPELLMMPEGIEVVIEQNERTDEEIASANTASKAALLSGFDQIEVDWSKTPAPGRRLVLVFNRAVDEVIGRTGVETVRLAQSGPP